MVMMTYRLFAFTFGHRHRHVGPRRRRTLHSPLTFP
jgi:hypothetical protein